MSILKFDMGAYSRGLNPQEFYDLHGGLIEGRELNRGFTVSTNANKIKVLDNPQSKRYQAK